MPQYSGSNLNCRRSTLRKEALRLFRGGRFRCNRRSRLVGLWVASRWWRRRSIRRPVLFCRFSLIFSFNDLGLLILSGHWDGRLRSFPISLRCLGPLLLCFCFRFYFYFCRSFIFWLW